MKKINIIKLTFITLLASIVLAGCGGGGSDASFENTTTGTIVASCTLPLASWTTITTGDVVSATSGTQLKFDHDSSNNKKVCVVVTTPAGSATIL